MNSGDSMRCPKEATFPRPSEANGNTFFIVRHGHSEANKQEIICSTPVRGQDPKYGLTEDGLSQSKEAAKLIAESVGGLAPIPGVLVVSSDYSRAKQTAEVIADTVTKAPVRICEALRERHFGDFEMKSNSHYQEVWDADKEGRTVGSVETVDAVVERISHALYDLDQEVRNQNIVLVSHGDILQILCAWLQGIDPSLHRTLPHLENGEVRKVWPLNGQSCPHHE